MNLDHLQILLWSLTYVLIIVSSIKECKNKGRYRPAIPYLAAAMNIGWEVNAVIVHWSFWGNILWLALDVIIIGLNTGGLKTKREKVQYLGLCVLMIGVFKLLYMLPEGMLISCFTIDALQALLFVLQIRKLSRIFRSTIGLTKMLGDLVAWLYYKDSAIVVNILGIAVLLLNLFYVAYALELSSRRE